METNTLPSCISSELKLRGLAPDDVKFYAMADLNLDCKFQDFYILLTEKQLIFTVMQESLLKQHVFSGYYNPRKEKRILLAKKGLSMEEKVAEMHFFDIEKTEWFRAENLVAGGLLAIKYEGLEKPLCMFNNQCLKKLSKLTELFGKLKEGKTLTAEDYDNHKDEQRCPKCGMLYTDQERQVCMRCMDKASLFVRMLRFFTPYKKSIILMFLCVVLSTGMSLVAPYLSGTVLFNNVLAKDEAFLAKLGLPAGGFITALVLLVLVLFITRVLQHLLQILQGRIVAKIVPMVLFKIRTNIFESLGRLSLSFFSKKQTGSLMTRINSDSNQVLFFFIDGLPYVFTNAFLIIAACVIMFVMNWKLALFTAITMPVLFIITFKMQPVLWHYYGKRHRSMRSLNAQVNDNITGARVVKAFGQEKTEIKRFNKVNNRVRGSEMDLVSYDNKFYAAFVTAEQLIFFSIWIAGAYLILSAKSMEYGTMMTFLGYVGMLVGPMDFLSFALRWWSSSMNAAQRIFEILDTKPEVIESPNPVALENIKGDIELKNVSFSYEPNKPILQNISFSVKNGEMLGIVGHSGAGKTTIVNLISRLYDINEGEILIDNVNVKDIRFADLRRNIGMVSQETYIFMGSIAENIAYAKPDASLDEIVNAAVAASAHDFIMKLPDGYDTQVGAGGRQLSGGERQRISIARAILANPKILILDEATASVDTETEKRIQNAIDKLVEGRTTISIAHRLSTLRNASKLIVIENGKITEQGTHYELAKQKGTYYKLMQLQSKALAVRGIGE